MFDSLDAMKFLLEGATYDGVNCESFSDDKGNGSSVEVETGQFYYALARRYKPKRVWHSGTHVGVDVAWLALGLKENGKYNPDYAGHIITVDVNPYNNRAEEIWQQCGLDNITRLIGRSDDAALIRGQIDFPLEMCVYDSDHATETVIAEFLTTYPYMYKHHCLLLFHDSRLDTRVGAGIGLVVNELKRLREEGKGWNLIAPWPFRNLRGLDGIFLSNEEFPS